MRGRLHSGLLALCALVAGPSRADEPHAFSELSSGLQLSARAGAGAWAEGDTTALFPGQAGAAAGKLSFGPAYGAEVLYRGSRGWALGVGGSWTSAGTGSAERAVASADWRGVLRLLSGEPGSFGEWAFDVSAGKGTVTARGAGESLSMEGWTAGVRASVELRPVAAAPWLRVGPYAALDGWFATRRCTGGSCADVAEMDYSDGLLSLGLGARFDLPLSYVRRPVAEYVEITSQVQLEASQPVAPEVTETPQYRAELAGVKVVALQAPSECASRTAAAATGQGTASGTLVKTDCGVEMGELERALTRAGYAVQSWTAVAALVRDEKITPRDAAARMGAQVLFQVNSLEQVRAVPITGAKWERRFYASDAHGRRGAPVGLPESDRAALRDLVSQPESELLAAASSRRGAMLDVSAIHVGSGQALWFYRWQRLDTPASELNASALGLRLDGGYWRRVEPEAIVPARPAAEELRSVESGEGRAGGAAESPGDATYFRVMREVIADFAQRFTAPGPRRD